MMPLDSATYIGTGGLGLSANRMKNGLLWFFTVLLTNACFASVCRAQTGFQLAKGQTQVSIPFEYVNNFIIIEVYLNAFLPYRLIFDTGAEHTILSKKDIMLFPGMRYDRTFHLIGSDLSSTVEAHLVRGVRMDILGKAASPLEDVLVLEENLLAFEEFTGVRVDGILSASVFDGYIFRINYQKKNITLFDRKVYQQPTGKQAAALPIEIYRQKPYFKANVHTRKESDAKQLKLLIDSGAGSSLILFTNTDSTTVMPEQVISGKIAMGLGGHLMGFVGRIDRCMLGPFEQRQVVAYYQEVDSLVTKDYLNQRNGLLGNGVLSHFLVDFDYQKQIMVLQPSSAYAKVYPYDRSGISLIASGKNLNQYIIQDILPDSPAQACGLLPGDRILSVNRFPAGILAMDGLIKAFRRKPGKELRVKVRRSKEELVFKLVLKDLL